MLSPHSRRLVLLSTVKRQRRLSCGKLRRVAKKDDDGEEGVTSSFQDDNDNIDDDIELGGNACNRKNSCSRRLSVSASRSMSTSCGSCCGDDTLESALWSDPNQTATTTTTTTTTATPSQALHHNISVVRSTPTFPPTYHNTSSIPPPPSFPSLELTSLLSSGAFTKVYTGVYQSTPVAVKVIENGVDADEKLRQIINDEFDKEGE